LREHERTRLQLKNEFNDLTSKPSSMNRKKMKIKKRKREKEKRRGEERKKEK